MIRGFGYSTIVLSFLSFSLSLAGELTPQQRKMEACNTEAGAKGLTGNALQKFMSACLSAKAMENTGASKQDKTGLCSKDASAKGLTGSERKQFMRACLSAK